MPKERSEISATDKWNVEAMYSSQEAWETDLSKWKGEEKTPRWPKIAAYKGRLAENAKTLKELIELCLELERNLSKLYTYAHLRHDEDVANEVHKKDYARITSVLHELRQEISWIEPEILLIPEKKMNEFLKSDELKDHRITLEKIIRLRPHTLSAEKEELVALTGKAFQTAYQAFNAFNNADLKFPSVTNSKGEVCELTHGKYLLYMRSPDRKLREGAFKAVHQTFKAYENMLAELINGQIQTHVFEMRAKNYSSCLEAALFPHQIDTSVYTSLIEAVRKGLKPLHKYLNLRKKLLGYNELHLYDLHVPLIAEVDMSRNYDEAQKWVVESVAPLGKEYQEVLKKGLGTDRWVDRYENAKKRSGAYSSGCYDSMPYILMNYHGTFNDMMTLAHEAGHSMHSYFSCHHQPYQYSQYPIFVAEVASTFNEELLVRDLMGKMQKKEEKCYLINQKIEDFRATLFRQTMFAEFELKLHEWAQQNVPITPQLLKDEYRELNKIYFGDAVVIDPEIDIEWARIPHFYYNFYVYQYATGISAAHALVENVQKEGEEARKRYVQFLSSGSSRFPIDLLSLAGADMRKPQVVESAIAHFDHLVDELAELMR
jgi:oligoendopeptidase F